MAWAIAAQLEAHPEQTSLIQLHEHQCDFDLQLAHLQAALEVLKTTQVGRQTHSLLGSEPQVDPSASRLDFLHHANPPPPPSPKGGRARALLPPSQCLDPGFEYMLGMHRFSTPFLLVFSVQRAPMRLCSAAVSCAGRTCFLHNPGEPLAFCLENARWTLSCPPLGRPRNHAMNPAACFCSHPDRLKANSTPFLHCPSSPYPV